MVELVDVGIIEENDIKIVVRKFEGTSGRMYSWDVIKNGGV